MNRSRLQRALRHALPLGLFLIIFGAKLLVIGKFGSDLPFWDQWDAEAKDVFMPYFEGKLTLAPFLASHNEHRIFFTRLLNFGLLLANGQWDARLQCVVNAALHAAILVALFAWARRHLGLPAAMTAFLILIAVSAPPIVWENTLAGFQSQFYFLTGFSLAAMWLFLSSSAWSWRWWLAIACALAAIFSMGSGFFCVLPVLALLAGQLWSDRSNWRSRLPTLIVCCAIAMIGWTLHTAAPENVSRQAHGLGDFLIAFLHSAAWPRINNLSLAPLAYLPFGFLCWQWYQRRRTMGPVHQFVLAGGLWALLQTVATAYARGAEGALPANRYGDISAVGAVFNGLALVLLFKDLAHGNRPRWWLFILSGAWCIALITGVWSCTHFIIKYDLPERKAWLQASETNVRAYLLTGHFVQTGPFTLPYPHPEVLAGMLDQPKVREILPASVRPPLPVERATGSWLAWQFTRQARWFLAAGCVLALAGLATTLRRQDNFN